MRSEVNLCPSQSSCRACLSAALQKTPSEPQRGRGSSSSSSDDHRGHLVDDVASALLGQPDRRATLAVDLDVHISMPMSGEGEEDPHLLTLLARNNDLALRAVLADGLRAESRPRRQLCPQAAQDAAPLPNVGTAVKSGTKLRALEDDVVLPVVREELVRHEDRDEVDREPVLEVEGPDDRVPSHVDANSTKELFSELLQLGRQQLARKAEDPDDLRSAEPGAAVDAVADEETSLQGRLRSPPSSGRGAAAN